MSQNGAMLRILKERRCVFHCEGHKDWVKLKYVRFIEETGHTIGLTKYFLRILIVAENIADFEKLFLVNCLVSLHVVHCPFINLTSMGGWANRKGQRGGLSKLNWSTRR